VSDRVAVVGVGVTPLRRLSPDASYREMTFEAATRAYADAGITHGDIDSFVSVCEDFHEGTSITDEYVPDQLGAVLRPVQTIAGDGIQGIATAFMLIRSGIADVVAVEAHAKSSNILRHDEVLAMGLDPVYERPLGVNPHYVAAMEMRRYLHDSGRTDTAVADVVVENRRGPHRRRRARGGAGERTAACIDDQRLRRRGRGAGPGLRRAGGGCAQTGLDPGDRLVVGHLGAVDARLGDGHVRGPGDCDGLPDGGD